MSLPEWPSEIPFQTFRRRCEALGLTHDLEASGGTRRAFLRDGDLLLEVHHRGTGGGHGGRHPVEIEAVRVVQGTVRAAIDGVPPKPRGLDALTPAARSRVESVLAELFAPVRGGAARPVSKGRQVEVVDGRHRGERGTVEWMGRRQGKQMVSVQTAGGTRFLSVAQVRVSEGPPALVKGMRVRVLSGEHQGRVGELRWVDPSRSDRVEVSLQRDPELDRGRGTPSAWLTLADVEPDT